MRRPAESASARCTASHGLRAHALPASDMRECSKPLRKKIARQPRPSQRRSSRSYSWRAVPPRHRRSRARCRSTDSELKLRLLLHHWPRLGSPRLHQHRANQEFDAGVGEQKGQAAGLSSTPTRHRRARSTNARSLPGRKQRASPGRGAHHVGSRGIAAFVNLRAPSLPLRPLPRGKRVPTERQRQR